ncbi:MAG: O-antigen ligase family protein [Candidatus Aceula meridiana]|nr:O-antigen ligase family protein [Candidatus Aceula meridiana]
MKSETFKNIIFFTLSAVMLFAPMFKGSVTLWSIASIQIIVFLLTCFWLWQKSNEKQLRFKTTKLDKPILIFFVLALVSAIFSIYPYASALELLRLAMYGAIYYLLINNFGRTLQIRFCSLIIMIACALSLFGLGQYFFGLNHSWWKPAEFLASTYVNHNHFAGYLEMAIALCCGFLLGLDKREHISPFRRKMWKVLLIIAGCLLLFAFVLTQSRGAWLSLSLAFLVYIIVLVQKKKFKKWTLFAYLVLLVVGTIFLYVGDDSVAKRVQTIKTKGAEASWQTRQRIWKGSITMIKDNPLLGTGVGTFVWGFPSYQPQGITGRAHYAHNDYLQSACEMGLFALPLIFWMIYVILSKGFYRDKNDSRLIRNIRLSAAIGLLSLMIHSAVDFNLHIPANMIAAAALAAIVMRTSKKNIEKD